MAGGGHNPRLAGNPAGSYSAPGQIFMLSPQLKELTCMLSVR